MFVLFNSTDLYFTNESNIFNLCLARDMILQLYFVQFTAVGHHTDSHMLLHPQQIQCKLDHKKNIFIVFLSILTY